MLEAITTCDGLVPETCTTTINAGDITFMLAFLIFLQALIFCGFLFNTFQKIPR